MILIVKSLLIRLKPNVYVTRFVANMNDITTTKTTTTTTTTTITTTTITAAAVIKSTIFTSAATSSHTITITNPAVATIEYHGKAK